MEKVTIFDVRGNPYSAVLVDGVPEIKATDKHPVFPFPVKEITNIDMICWFENGVLHRLDGPAIECLNGYKEWRVNGRRHRLDGPAVEYAYGGKQRYVNGKAVHFLPYLILKLKYFLFN